MLLAGDDGEGSTQTPPDDCRTRLLTLCSFVLVRLRPGSTMAGAGSAAELALDFVNKAAGQFPAQQLSAFLETAQLSAFLETATDSEGEWPMEVFVFDLLCSILTLTFGYFWLKTPSMPKKRLSWVLSALTSMTCATLSMYHVHKLYRHDWDCGAIFFTDDRLSRFTVTFFVAFLLLDLLLGCESLTLKHPPALIASCPMTHLLLPSLSVHVKQRCTTASTSASTAGGSTTSSTWASWRGR